MALSDVMSMYAPQASLEAKFPGFRACFGGEELRRAEAAMSSKLVGGTIEALLASDMPPSLAQLTNHSKQLDRQMTLVNPAPTSSTRQFDRLFSFAPGASPIQAQSRADPSGSSSPTASPRVTPRVTEHGGQAAGASELDHLAHIYQLELERLGVVQSTSAAATGIDRMASAPPDPSGSGPAPSGSVALPDPPSEGSLVGRASQTLTSSPGYASACFEATYSCGLVLQDLAARCVPGSEPHQTKLQEACDMYALAVRYRPTAHSALYNWGVALSDLARAMRPTDPAGAKSCLEAACQRYSQALEAHPDTPQALNNWGLVLQELSGLARGRKDRDALLRQACGKFRQAVRLRPEFDRGVYNLGTVCYAAACTLQGELTATPASPPSQQQHQQQPQPGPGQEGGAHGTGHHHQHHHHHHHHHDPVAQRAAKEAEVRSLFTSAAQYIVLAYALQQTKEIYRKSLGVVRRLLPLPFLRAGFLTACIPSTQGTPEEAWRQDWFILDAFSLRSATGAEGNLSVASLAAASAQGSAGLLLPPQALALPLEQISHVSRLHDPTLPKGEAFVVVMHGAQLEPGQEVVLVAENEDTAEGWVDVLTLAAHCVQSRATEALSEALTPLGGAVGPGAMGAHGLP